MAAHLETHPGLAVADVCFTANARSRHAYRAALVVATLEDVCDGLRAVASSSDGEPAGASPKIAFVFGAAASARAGMGRELYETQPVFRAVVDKQLELRHSPPAEVIFGDDDAWLNDPALTRSATFALSQALAGDVEVLGRRARHGAGGGCRRICGGLRRQRGLGQRALRHCRRDRLGGLDVAATLLDFCSRRFT